MVYVGDGRVDFVITDFEGKPGRSPEERLEKEPVVRHVVSMTYSYVARLTKTKLLPARTGRVRPIGQLLYPWIVERAVYELFYESMYRPTWISITIVGLLEAEVYKKAL
jgi:predicted trehalose synthase